MQNIRPRPAAPIPTKSTPNRNYSSAAAANSASHVPSPPTPPAAPGGDQLLSPTEPLPFQFSWITFSLHSNHTTIRGISTGLRKIYDTIATISPRLPNDRQTTYAVRHRTSLK